MTIAKPKIKHHGPACACGTCQVEWREFRDQQREIDEAVHRERLVAHLARCGHGEPSDQEATWIGGAS